MLNTKIPGAVVDVAVCPLDALVPATAAQFVPSTLPSKDTVAENVPDT
ncbi:MAG: hypothetical protein AB7V08_14935 [Elusimicrobiales bacterium]